MEIPEGFANIRYIFTCDGVADPMSFGIGAQPDLGMSAEDAAILAYNNFSGVFISTPASMLLGWTFVGTQVTKTVAGEPTIGEHSDPISGTTSSPGLVVNTGVLVRKLTAEGGRKHRGRMFIPPFNVQENQVTVAGQLDAAFVTSQSNAWTSVRLAHVTDNLPFYLLHSDPVDTPTLITGFIAQGLAATQRRRMR